MTDPFWVSMTHSDEEAVKVISTETLRYTSTLKREEVGCVD